MTDNPMTIMIVNMTIVFVVLFLLGVVIEMIHRLDPTKNSAKEQEAEPVVTYAVSAPIVEEPRLTQEAAEVADYEAVMDKESTVR